MKALFGTLFFVTFTLCASAQGNANSVKETEIRIELEKAAPVGTYEFVHLRIEENFTPKKMQEILIMAEKKRHLTDTVYFKVSDFTTVKIYPKGIGGSTQSE